MSIMKRKTNQNYILEVDSVYMYMYVYDDYILYLYYGGYP